MRLPLSILLLAALAPFSYGASVKLPPEVHGEAGSFVQVKADTTDKVVKWYALDKGLNLFPTELLKDTKTAVVSASTPGRYRVLAYTASGDDPSEPAVCTVVIGGGPSPPIPPPVPPDVPPQPLTPLRSAYLNESDPAREEQVLKLSALYRQFAMSLANGEGSYKTWGDLFEAMSAAAKGLGINGKVMKVQAVIQAKLREKLPVNGSEPFDQAARSLASLTFLSISRELDAVVK